CQALLKNSPTFTDWFPPIEGTRWFSFPRNSGYRGVPDDSHMAMDQGRKAAIPELTQIATVRSLSRRAPGTMTALTTTKSTTAGPPLVRIATPAAAVTPIAAAATTRPRWFIV